MKVYPKENVMCTIIKVKNQKTFRGRVKHFISAIADLEADTVSDFFLFVSYLMYIYLIFLFFLRFNSTIG